MSGRRIVLPFSALGKPVAIQPVASRYAPKPQKVLNDPQNKFVPGLSLDREQVGAAIEAHHWKFAKSMPKWPHWYTLRENWTSAIPWENVVQFLRDDGKAGWFGSGKKKSPRDYWFFNGHVYWSMGAPLAETILINRQPDTPADYYGVYR